MTIPGRRILSLWALTLALLPAVTARSAPVALTEQPPASITAVASNLVLVDFGRVAFGNLQLTPPAGAGGRLVVHFGEAIDHGRIDRHPPGAVRYQRVAVSLSGEVPLVVAPPPDRRNTAQPMAALTPPAWGVVLPFRWVEIEGWPGPLQTNQIRRRAAFAADWNDAASKFECSDTNLNQIWDLCRYSIKATTFAGVYVDGDRERIPYEADAYFSQLGQYYTDGGTAMARDTFDRLLRHPTWPTEWAMHMIFMACADWMQTGDTNWLAAHYEILKTKLREERVRPDGLLGSNEAQRTRDDIVDWPESERDGFVFTTNNTVVNAFYLRALAGMTELATALHQNADAVNFHARQQVAAVAFQARFFDPTSGLYRDGEGAEHTSLHANLFPLAFGLVPADRRPAISHWLVARGMKCSVYGAQYLLDGLFANGCDTEALGLMTAPGDRSWAHMVASGTTITWEAWDQKYKPNQDWTHAWGAAPANLLPRYVLGVQPLEPGWKRVAIAPHPGGLSYADGIVPSPLGPVTVHWTNGASFTLSVHLPPGMTAQINLPGERLLASLLLNGHFIGASRHDGFWQLPADVTGNSTAVLKSHLAHP